VPISFIYGENDWVHILEEGTAEEILCKNKYWQGPNTTKNGIYVSKVHIVPTSDHAM
jgi:hypothetical protein